MKKLLLTSLVCAASLYAQDTKIDMSAGYNVIPAEKRTFDQSQYIPDISVVMDASYVHRSKKSDDASHLELSGISESLYGEHVHDDVSHATYNAKDGFNLNYAELVLSSNVDPFFTMDAVFHFSRNGVAVEELFFTSTALGNGLRLKGGKFLSNFGRINQQHHHVWDFGDMPLVYEAFLGMHGINEVGAQLQWIAPTPLYMMAGFEVLQGENEKMFGNQALSYETSTGDTEEILGQKRAPSLFVGYLKTSFDMGDTTVLAGLSYAHGTSRIADAHDHGGGDQHLFGGTSKLYGADLTLKHAFDSYSFLTWQSEWLSRDMDGREYDVVSGALADSESLRKQQTGLYSQLVYAIDQNYRVGGRFDYLCQNDVKAGGDKEDLPNNFSRYSVMAEYHTSEFARFRLQYNYDKGLIDHAHNEEKTNLHTIMLQANISIGAHGAHSF
ncbi:MAG: hypothetical protein RBR54_05360 [Sulfurimonas sp.]|nr:hypothetical protein [Sulfurimonas sp.]